MSTRFCGKKILTVEIAQSDLLLKNKVIALFSLDNLSSIKLESRNKLIWLPALVPWGEKLSSFLIRNFMNQSSAPEVKDSTSQ